jgi:hypothetical protein
VSKPPKEIKTNFETYKEKFEKAFLAFKYQVVYCPIKKTMVNLSCLDGAEDKYQFFKTYKDNLSFLGE